MGLKQAEVLVAEEIVLMTEREADMILQRVFGIGDLYEVNSGEDLEWFYLYDLVEENSVIGFVTDNEHQIDVVQIDDGNGYAFNFWKNNHFHGQIIMDNSWEVINVITE